MVFCSILAALFTAGLGILIAGFGDVYTGTDLPLFVKVDNVPDQEVVSSQTFSRTVQWFPSQDMGLAMYAESFAGRGIAALVFDYRTFGARMGCHGTSLIPSGMWKTTGAALDYVRGPALVGRVDSSRVALWGTSFAGGHVIKVAAADAVPDSVGSIRAVVSQVPHLDGRAASKKSLKERGKVGTLKMAAAVIGDGLRGLLGMQARYVALVGCNGDGKIALMSLSQEGCTSYFAKHPSELLGGWRPQVCARIGAMVGMYSPINALPEVKAPVLFVAAERDELCPADIVRRAAAEAPNAKLSIHNSTHFDIYMGETLQVILKDMGEFLEEHLKP